jgi:predicted Fe-Mo cluster-binding NifX family protein
MFLIVDAETKAVHVVRNPDFDHEHGQGRPLGVLADEKFDAVVVSGIGPGALGRLRDGRVSVYHTSRATVGEALDAIARGALPPVLADEPLAQGLGHGHGHRHRGGAGRGPHRHRHGRA